MTLPDRGIPTDRISQVALLGCVLNFCGGWIGVRGRGKIWELRVMFVRGLIRGVGCICRVYFVFQQATAFLLLSGLRKALFPSVSVFNHMSPIVEYPMTSYKVSMMVSSCTALILMAVLKLLFDRWMMFSNLAVLSWIRMSRPAVPNLAMFSLP